MVNQKIKTKVVHSLTKQAYNVIGINLGGKHKIARIPYEDLGNKYLNAIEKQEAHDHAKFISDCFNNSKEIYEKAKLLPSS